MPPRPARLQAQLHKTCPVLYQLEQSIQTESPYFVSQQPYTHRHVTFKSLSNITIYVETFIDAALQALQTMAENAGKDGIRYYETVTQAIFGE